MTQRRQQTDSSQGSRGRGRLVVPGRTLQKRQSVSPVINFPTTFEPPVALTQPKVSQAPVSKSLQKRTVQPKASKVHHQAGSAMTRHQQRKVAEKRHVRSTKTHKKLGATVRRTQLLAQSLEQPSTKKRRKLSWKQHVLHGCAAVLVVLSAYVSVDTWLTNRKVEAQYTTPSTQQATDQSHQEREGKDESELPAGSLASYQTAPDSPRAVYIDKLKVAARLQPMGVNADNSLQAPINIYDAGWYTGSAIPSQGGAVVIDGHASGPTREGLFAYLDTLVKGDRVTVETGNGKKYTYKVIAKETVDRTKVDMQKLMLPYGNIIQGANFITCSGDWQQNDQTFSKRTVVYTELVK